MSPSLIRGNLGKDAFGRKYAITRVDCIHVHIIAAILHLCSTEFSARDAVIQEAKAGGKGAVSMRPLWTRVLGCPIPPLVLQARNL